jgi:hypothetical protein
MCVYYAQIWTPKHYDDLERKRRACHLFVNGMSFICESHASSVRRYTRCNDRHLIYFVVRIYTCMSGYVNHGHIIYMCMMFKFCGVICICD